MMRANCGTPIAPRQNGIKNGFIPFTFIRSKEEAIMIEKSKVKVIKKGEIGKAAVSKVPAKPRSKRAAARDIVTNVSTWVQDFQAKRRDETKSAIEQFFGTPQPSEL